ncbi:hypothetical protein HYT74_01300 [Candidatus Daviesbacteria bacterium]|nr:hypothetical protein [Candidatus Daviesbacteria bacterium]
MQCQYIKEDGEQCGAMSIKEATFCFSHNPETQQDKQLAVTKGGYASKKTVLALVPLEIKTPQQVVDLLESTINSVRSGEIPPNIANTIGYLAGHMLKALEVSDMDQRVEMIESVLFQRKIASKGRKF